MILRNWKFLKENWSVFISHLWLSPPFSVLLLNPSQSHFPLQLFLPVLLHSCLSSLPFLPCLFCFPPPPPQSAEVTPLTLLTLSTLAHFRPLPFPRCLAKVTVLGPTMCLTFELCWKQGTRDSAPAAWTLPAPWFQLCREAVAGGTRGSLFSQAQSFSLQQSLLAPDVGQRQAIFDEEAF